MRYLIIPLLLSCNPPPPTDIGQANTLSTTTLDTYLGSRVTISGTPTPTATVEYTRHRKTCRFFYLIGNHNLFVEDCLDSTPPFTGTLKPFTTLLNHQSLTTYFRDHFSITIKPASTYVLSTDS